MTSKDDDKRFRYPGSHRRRTILDAQNTDFRVKFESELGKDGIVQLVFFDDEDETQVCLPLDAFYVFFDYLRMKEKSILPTRKRRKFPTTRFLPNSKEKIR